MKRRFYSVFLIFLFAFLIDRLRIWRDVESIFYDQKLRLTARPAPEEIILVEIDQHSLDFYSRTFHLPFPWPRSLYAYAVDFLRGAGARLVALDMIFSEPDRFGEDGELARSFRESGNLILPVLLKQGSGDISRLDLFRLPDHFSPSKGRVDGGGILLPIPEILKEIRGCGNVAEKPDRDGVFRRLYHLNRFQGKLVPSFSLAMARFLRPGLDGRSIPFRMDGSLPVFFYRFPHTRYSICDLIQAQLQIKEGKNPEISASVFKGKTVIIGATAPGLLDMRPNPLNPTGSGFEISANALGNFLQGDYIRVLPPFLYWLLIFGLTVGLTFFLYRFKRFWTQAMTTIMVLATLAGGIFLLFLLYLFHIPILTPALAVLLASAVDLSQRYQQMRMEKKKIKTMFESYLSGDLLKHLLRRPDVLSLRGEKRPVTIFFSDLAGFTALSEKLDPDQVVSLLNQYLERMTDIIKEMDGWVNKFQGDAIMAVWGAPIEIPDSELKALRAAWRCRCELEVLNREFTSQGLPTLGMRVGINSGEVIVGDIGSQRRREYTVIGDAVNLASRLEGINKQYGTSVICGSQTHDLVSGRMILRRIDRVRVKGKENPEDIFEVMGESAEVSGEQSAMIAGYERALEFYFSGDFSRALEILHTHTGDSPSDTIARRCRYLLDHPPLSWDGVWTFSEK